MWELSGLHCNLKLSPDRRTSKFIKVKCNPTNEKLWPTAHKYNGSKRKAELSVVLKCITCFHCNFSSTSTTLKILDICDREGFKARVVLSLALLLARWSLGSHLVLHLPFHQNRCTLYTCVSYRLAFWTPLMLAEEGRQQCDTNPGSLRMPDLKASMLPDWF